MHNAQKWASFVGIPPECWRPVSAANSSTPIWSLNDDWRTAIFSDEYLAVSTNADPLQGPGGAVVFVSRLGLYEARVFSRLRPGDYYDFSWDFEIGSKAPALPPNGNAGEAVGSLDQRAISVPRWAAERASGSAKIVWLINPTNLPSQVSPGDFKLRIFSADIDEIIEVNLASLEMSHHVGAREQQQLVLPWRRLLIWFARLRDIDRTAFGKIPAPLRNFIDAGDALQRIDRLPMAAFQDWARQGLLPTELPAMNPDEVGPLRESVRLQQGLAAQPDFLKLFNQFCPIPQLLLRVDAGSLEPVDLQVFMTIGALRELHGFLEVEMNKLIATRPHIQAILRSPERARQLELDEEIRALRLHPRAVREQLDLNDVKLRRAGQWGPTARDLQRFQEHQMGMINAQTAGIMHGPIVGLAAAVWNLHQTSHAAGDDPPWKLYTPYLC